MGYRHQVISDTMIPKKESLPEWFVARYEKVIDFDRDFWASHTEYKRYGALGGFEEDVQKVMIEKDLDEIVLIFFADESDVERPDVSHVTVTQSDIVERRPTDWKADKRY